MQLLVILMHNMMMSPGIVTQGFVMLSSSPAASAAVGPAQKTRSANTKGQASAKPTAKAKAKALDPVHIACTWRRRTLKDFNKMNAVLTSCKMGAENAIHEAFYVCLCVCVCVC